MYKEMGYENRQDYLACMADEYDIQLDTVKALANVLGPEEDFDGLVVSLEDYADEME
jgi:hypothetical protein